MNRPPTWCARMELIRSFINRLGGRRLIPKKMSGSLLEDIQPNGGRNVPRHAKSSLRTTASVQRELLQLPNGVLVVGLNGNIGCGCHATPNSAISPCWVVLAGGRFLPNGTYTGRWLESLRTSNRIGTSC